MRGPDVSPPLSRAGSRSITGDAGDMPNIMDQPSPERVTSCGPELMSICAILPIFTRSDADDSLKSLAEGSI